MKELASGCICCTLKGEMTEAISLLIEEQDPDIIFMELTGVAYPGEVALQLATLDTISIGNIVCLVDSSTFLKYGDKLPILNAQVSESNIILLNKIDLLNKEQLESVLKKVCYYSAPAVQIKETLRGEVDLDFIFRDQELALSRITPGLKKQKQVFKSVSIETEKTFSLKKLLSFFEERQAEFIRVKGIIRTEKGEKLIQISLSGLEIKDWNENLEKSRLVLIAEDMDARSLEKEVNELCFQ
jgi:G3E family GTPase